MNNKYESAFSVRYASNEMQELFSADARYTTWRKLWVALARAEANQGLPITPEQIAELEQHIYDIDYDCVKERERQVRHDVMAHIYAYGQVAPSAAGIIHLGATSCYVTDNADLIIYRDALRLIKRELVSLCDELAKFCDKYKALPTLGYTHYQPAQLVTVGKRASLWLQNFVTDLEEIEFAIESVKFRGAVGTTGTEASFAELYNGDVNKIKQMNLEIASAFGFESCFDVCGQTYPRKLDSRILNVLSSIGQSCYKMAEDIRLLQHDRQIEEPFGDKQVGSSAMAYKQNPMRCERICSLSRFLMSLPMNAAMTASTQWFERTLDDSANRRVSIPEAFLCCDGVIRLAENVVSGLRVNEKIIEKFVMEYLPFIATENILMAAVKKGGHRQEIHELIRKCSVEATAEMKEGRSCDLMKRLSQEEKIGLSLEELETLLNPSLYTGICDQQVAEYIEKLAPILENAEKIDSGIEL